MAARNTTALQRNIASHLMYRHKYVHWRGVMCVVSGQRAAEQKHRTTPTVKQRLLVVVGRSRRSSENSDHRRTRRSSIRLTHWQCFTILMTVITLMINTRLRSLVCVLRTWENVGLGTREGSVCCTSSERKSICQVINVTSIKHH